MKRATIILAALCVAFTMAASASAAVKTDYVTRGLLCIHTHEGSWTDGGSPYYGGLQMNIGFQRSYGFTYVRVFGKNIRVDFPTSWGTADHWPIEAQLEAGRNGYKDRGWWPWRNTARMCGLI